MRHRFAAAVLAMAALGAAGYLAWRLNGSPGTAASYEGTRLSDRAPDFRLEDQNARRISLADFRGSIVVLTLLDPYCTDICPVYAQQYRLAYRSLGPAASKVAFLAFNANDAKTSVRDVAAATAKWGMSEIPSWHFLTGTPGELHAVWRAYGMYASGRPKAGKPAEKEHSPAMYVIDASGKRRWYFSTNFEGAPAPSELIVKHARALLSESAGK